MGLENYIFICLSLFILILLIWNIYGIKEIKKLPIESQERSGYFELNAKLNYITAFGSFLILITGYLGFNAKDAIIKSSKPMVDSLLTNEKNRMDSLTNKLDSIVQNKNILRADIYIVSDIGFKLDSAYKFSSLMSIDNKKLPDFQSPPKIVINTATGESVRIKKITNTYFILGEAQSQEVALILENNNPQYKKIDKKFDVWIADYKNSKKM